jgi:asparagine synthetase B (glutamine-hydrolysing)
MFASPSGSSPAKTFLARPARHRFIFRTDKHFRARLEHAGAARGATAEIDPVAPPPVHLHAVVPPPFTILKGIRKLEQGTTLSIDAAGRTVERRYWSLKAQRPAIAKTAAEWTEAIHEALRVAVKKRIEIADVKVGVLLSGGLDSCCSSRAAGGAGRQRPDDILHRFRGLSRAYGEERGTNSNIPTPSPITSARATTSTAFPTPRYCAACPKPSTAWPSRW